MCSEHNTAIVIAGIRIELKSALSPSELRIEERLGQFLGAAISSEDRVVLRWQESAGEPSPDGDMIYDPGSIWRMFRKGGQTCAAMRYTSETTQGVLRANSTWDDLTLTERRDGAEWISLLNLGAGELLLRTRILFTGGLVFHAYGIDDNGCGVAFVGHSGAGKSTQASLWAGVPGVIAMNDDRVAVRPTATGALIYGTPWGGAKDIARNHSAPLAAIVVLEQASENSIEPLSISLAAPMLLARTFLPYWDPSLMQLAFTNLQSILARVSVFRLRCRPEMAVVPLVRSIL